jgi:hypothetical protein
MNLKQELRAWSLVIAALIKKPHPDSASDLQACKNLAAEISVYIRGAETPFSDPRYNPNPK